MTDPALSRARAVLNANRYFALATVDKDGPWVATLAYTVGSPNYLYFFSEKTSRHGQALLTNSKVAGVIYDSTCSPSNAESLQFSGIGELAHDLANIEYVLMVGAKRDGQSVPTGEQIEASFANTSTVLFRVSVVEAFVLDQELFATKGIDGRLQISVPDIF